MPKLPVLSAKDAIKILRKFGFQVYGKWEVIFICGTKSENCLLLFQTIQS